MNIKLKNNLKLILSQILILILSILIFGAVDMFGGLMSVIKPQYQLVGTIVFLMLLLQCYFLSGMLLNNIESLKDAFLSIAGLLLLPTIISLFSLLLNILLFGYLPSSMQNTVITPYILLIYYPILPFMIIFSNLSWIGTILSYLFLLLPFTLIFCGVRYKMGLKKMWILNIAITSIMMIIYGVLRYVNQNG